MSPFARSIGAPAHRQGALHARALRLGGTRPRRAGVTARMLLAAGACAGTGLLLAACAGAGTSTSTSGAGVAAPERGMPAPIPGSGAQQPGAPAARAALAKLTPPSQAIIYTANLTLRVRRLTAVAATATSLVTGAGGYVSGEREVIPPGGQGTAQISLELKIPVAAYHQTLAGLAGLGTQLAFSQQAQDVTQQVADVSSRVASAQAAIRQLRALLSRAGSIGDLLAVQDEINSEESALESLLAQQSALSHETSYGTVSLLLVGPHVVIVRKHKKKAHGFLAGLSAGWRALVAVVDWLLTALGAVLPFALPVALLAVLAYRGRHKLPRRKPPPAAEPPPAAAGS